MSVSQTTSQQSWLGLHQWKIGQKIGLGYAITLGILISGSIIGHIAGNYYTNRAQVHEEEAIHETIELYKFRTSLSEIKLSLRRLRQYPTSSTQFQTEYIRLKDNAESFQRSWSDYKKEYKNKQSTDVKESPEELQLYTELIENHNQAITAYISQLNTFSTEKDTANTLELENLQQQLISDQQLLALREFSEDLEELITVIALDKLEQAKSDLKTAGTLRNQIIGVSILLSATISILFAAYFSRLISRPILAVNRVAQRIIDETNFTLQAPIDTNDEIGALATTLNLLVQRVKILLQENEERTQNLLETNERLISTQTQMIAQEKLASLGALTAGIAHEIKNPLNFVNNFSELSVDLLDDLITELESLKQHLKPDIINEVGEIIALLKMNVAKIEHHGKRADKIVANMLMQSRGGEGARTDININELVAEAVNLAYHGMRSQHSDFNLELDHDYDGTIKPIKAFAQDLNRVFLNISNNACYAIYQRQCNEKKNFNPTLKIRTRDRGNQIEISFRDNGIGITPDVKEKVFDQFFTTKPTGEGTGLGLSLSHNIIVKQHLGSITVDSEPNLYTDFIITLPKTSWHPLQQQRIRQLMSSS